ncbi:MAG: 4Fe-4S binding protein [Chloroflexi bacterium]|nr:4Fe-4S binding protein [Chloroflexota bacterium]
MDRGIIICRCQGRIASGINLDEVVSSLSRHFPVGMAEALCDEPGEIPAFLNARKVRSVVIGACSIPDYLELFRKAAREASASPFQVHPVNLREQCAMAHSRDEATAKAMLLLGTEGCLTRGEVGPENLKVGFGVPPEGATRRELFNILKQPRYVVVPSIRSDLCTGKWGCRLCLSSCPSGSIKGESGTVTVEKAGCDGCGACVPACPWGAIHFPPFTPDIAEERMAHLASDKPDGLSPRILLVHCRGSESILNRMGAAGIRYPASVIPYYLPCLATLSPFLVLRAFQLGAEGVAVLPCQNECLHGLELVKMRRALGFVHRLMPHLGLGRERLLRVLDGDLPSVGDQLTKMAEEIQKLGPRPMPGTRDGHPASPFSPLVLAGLVEKSGNSFVIEGNDVPFGLVDINSELCTVCRLCTSVCRSGALAFERSGTELGLMFRHSQCYACGECVRVCPTRALHVKRALKGSLVGLSLLLLRVGVVSCPDCGGEVAPAPLMKILHQKLQAPEEVIQGALLLCPACRLKRLPRRGLPAGRGGTTVK